MRSLRPLALFGLLALVAGGAPALSGCDSGGDAPASCMSTDTFATEDMTPDDAQLGDAIEDNDCVTVRYVGRLADGSGTFDQGVLRFVLTPQRSNAYFTAGDYLPGFVLGLAGQRVGQTRRVRIPPDLGYGTRVIPDRDPDDDRVGIPACSTIEFDVTVTAIDEDIRVCAR